MKSKSLALLAEENELQPFFRLAALLLGHWSSVGSATEDRRYVQNPVFAKDEDTAVSDGSKT